MLIRKIAKAPKRSSRFRSQKHLNHVRSHACVVCDAEAPIEVAHLRLGTHTGMGQRPDDWSATPLCKSCHAKQHTIGEATFWERFAEKDPQAIIAELIRTSPARREIEAHRNG
jgi:hypothetical protein